jgi:hypothetical protein
VSNAVVLISLTESAASLALYESGRKAASRRLDRATFWLLLVLYVSANGYLILPQILR